jgi:pyocin large subunit-like protein
MGGYLFDNNHNNDEISINILIEKINTKKCSDNDNNLINIYNNYQVNMFFYNLINYVCYTNTFLNQPKNGGKTKSRKTKSRKIKSRKIKSRKNSKKYKT